MASLLALRTAAPSWQEKFGQQIHRVQQVAEEEDNKTTHHANVEAKHHGWKTEVSPMGREASVMRYHPFRIFLFADTLGPTTPGNAALEGTLQHITGELVPMPTLMMPLLPCWTKTWTSSPLTGCRRVRRTERKMPGTICYVLSRHGQPRRQLIAHAGEGFNIDGDRGKLDPNSHGVKGDHCEREAHHVRRAARIAQGRWRGEHLLHDWDPAPGMVGGCAVEHAGQAEMARGIQGAGDDPECADEVPPRQDRPMDGYGVQPLVVRRRGRV